MRPVAFYLGSFPVHSYAVMMALGFMAAGVVMQRDFVRKGHSGDLAWSILLFGAVGGLLGSRLLAALHNGESLAADPWGWMMGEQGMVWYGGLFGGLTEAQWVGLGLVVVGGVWLALGLRPMTRFIRHA